MTLLDQSPAPATPVARMTASDVNAAIQRHFGTGGEQYAVLFEVRNGTAGRANRSVDAVVMSLWPSLGMELWGMEVKVSRHDWKRELDNPAKASEVFGYFDRWFLVAPEDVVRPGELPEPWGHFVPSAEGLRHARPAAKNTTVKAVDRHFLGALLRRVAKTDDAFIRRALETALAEQRQKFSAEADKRALERIGELREDAQHWLKLRGLLKTKPDDYIYAPDVVEAVRLVLKCGVAKTYGGMLDVIRALDAAKSQFDKIAADLKFPKKERRK